MSSEKDLIKAIKEMTDSGGTGWGDRVDGFALVVKEICLYYAEKLGYDPVEVFKALEKKRDYSYPNYYQWAKFPKLDDVKVFETGQDLHVAIQPKKGFRCPACSGISKNAQVCDTGIRKDGKVCDWKSYGLFGTMGKGIRFIVKKNWIYDPVVSSCFMPVAMED